MPHLLGDSRDGDDADAAAEEAAQPLVAGSEKARETLDNGMRFVGAPQNARRVGMPGAE